MADTFRVPMEVTYAIEGGEPALLAYRRWRNISRDDLASKSGIPGPVIKAIEDGKVEIEEAMLERLADILKVPQDQLIRGLARRTLQSRSGERERTHLRPFLPSTI